MGEMRIQKMEIDERDDPQRQELRRLTLARSDMRSARRLAGLLIDALGQPRRDPDLEMGLMTGLVVSYARPFTRARIGRLRGRRWERFDGNENFEAWHAQLLGIRKKLYAHTDFTYTRQIIVLPAGAWGKIGTTTVEAQPPWAQDAIESFAALMDFQIARLSKAVERLVDEIYAPVEAGTAIELRLPHGAEEPGSQASVA